MLATFLFVNVYAGVEKGTNEQDEKSQASEIKQQSEVEQSFDKRSVVEIPQPTEDERLEEKKPEKKRKKDRRPSVDKKKVAVAGTAIAAAFVVAWLCDRSFNNGERINRLLTFFKAVPDCYRLEESLGDGDAYKLIRNNLRRYLWDLRCSYVPVWRWKKLDSTISEKFGIARDRRFTDYENFFVQFHRFTPDEGNRLREILRVQ